MFIGAGPPVGPGGPRPSDPRDAPSWGGEGLCDLGVVRVRSSYGLSRSGHEAPSYLSGRVRTDGWEIRKTRRLDWMFERTIFGHSRFSCAPQESASLGKGLGGSIRGFPGGPREGVSRRPPLVTGPADLAQALPLPAPTHPSPAGGVGVWRDARARARRRSARVGGVPPGTPAAAGPGAARGAAAVPGRGYRRGPGAYRTAEHPGRPTRRGPGRPPPPTRPPRAPGSPLTPQECGSGCGGLAGGASPPAPEGPPSRRHLRGTKGAEASKNASTTRNISRSSRGRRHL